MTPKTWPEESDYQPRCTHSGSVMCWHACVYVAQAWRRRHQFVRMCACICPNASVQTYGLTSMQTPQRAVGRDQCLRVKVPTAAYLAISLSSRSSKKNLPLSWTLTYKHYKTVQYNDFMKKKNAHRLPLLEEKKKGKDQHRKLTV